MAKDCRKGVKHFILTRADKKLEVVLVDFSGPKVVGSLGRNRYTLIVRDDFSRYAWAHFMRHNSDAVEFFEQFLADSRTDGVPPRW